MTTSIVNKHEHQGLLSRKVMSNAYAVNLVEPRYVEVFLLYPMLVDKRKFDIKNFFHSEFNDLDKRLAGQPVFLSQEIASQYNRFTGNHHCILKVYVLDAAIEGRSHGLVLRKGYMARPNIYDCMVMTGHGMQRWLNPEFNEEYRSRCCL